MPAHPDDRKCAAARNAYVSREVAALRLGIDLAQMIDWNMVVMIPRGNSVRVPEWCLDHRVARALPLLSDYFRGEALEMCLLSMRPCGDDRDGVDALRDGEWEAVRALLAAHRRRFDHLMRKAGTGDWMAQFRVA